MSLTVNLNQQQIATKVRNDMLGKFVALEWKRLIDPYTPRDTGNLVNNVSILPFRIKYKSKYAHRQYHGRNFDFRDSKNEYATYEWDRAAEQAGQKDKLYRTLNSVLKKGRY